MDQPRRRLSELSFKELAERATEYRRMALDAADPTRIKSLNMLAVRYAMLAAKREVEEATTNASPEPGHPEVQKLIASAERAAHSVADPVRALANSIKAIATSKADPYLTIGVLLEGAVHILRTSLPTERQMAAVFAFQRLSTNGYK